LVIRQSFGLEFRDDKWRKRRRAARSQIKKAWLEMKAKKTGRFRVRFAMKGWSWRHWSEMGRTLARTWCASFYALALGPPQFFKPQRSHAENADRMVNFSNHAVSC
jgi:hypothetical protein